MMKNRTDLYWKRSDNCVSLNTNPRHTGQDQVSANDGGKDRKIVVYCANFECPASIKAAEKLDKAGFRQIFDYEGGTEEWLANHKHH